MPIDPSPPVLTEPPSRTIVPSESASTPKAPWLVGTEISAPVGVIELPPPVAQIPLSPPARFRTRRRPEERERGECSHVRPKVKMRLAGRANSRKRTTIGATAVRHDGSPERVASTPPAVPVEEFPAVSQRSDTGLFKRMSLSCVQGEPPRESRTSKRPPQQILRSGWRRIMARPPSCLAPSVEALVYRGRWAKRVKKNQSLRPLHYHEHDGLQRRRPALILRRRQRQTRLRRGRQRDHDRSSL